MYYKSHEHFLLHKTCLFSIMLYLYFAKLCVRVRLCVCVCVCFCVVGRLWQQQDCRSCPSVCLAGAFVTRPRTVQTFSSSAVSIIVGAKSRQYEFMNTQFIDPIPYSPKCHGFDSRWSQLKFFIELILPTTVWG